MNAHVSIMDTAAPATLPDRSTVEAYREWLHYEGRFCGMELYPELGTDAERLIPCKDVDFHFPRNGLNWTDVPPPSTRARLVLEAVGAIPAAPSPELVALIAAFEKAEAARLKLVRRYGKAEKELKQALNGKLSPSWKIPNHAPPIGFGRTAFHSSDEANACCDEAARRARVSYDAGLMSAIQLDRAITQIEMHRGAALECLRPEEAIRDASGVDKIDAKVEAASDVADTAWDKVYGYRCTSMADVRAKVSMILAHRSSYEVTEDHVEDLLRSLIGRASA